MLQKVRHSLFQVHQLSFQDPNYIVLNPKYGFLSVPLIPKRQEATDVHILLLPQDILRRFALKGKAAFLHVQLEQCFQFYTVPHRTLRHQENRKEYENTKAPLLHNDYRFIVFAKIV